MKTPEDEAFDELARKQGAWGGGYQAKRTMAADKLQEPVREALKLALEALETERDIYREHDEDGAPEYILDAIASIRAALAQPAQEQWKCIGPPCKCNASNAKQCCYAVFTKPAQPAQERQWIWLSDFDISEVVDTTCQYTGSYEEYLIKKAERKIRSMNNE